MASVSLPRPSRAISWPMALLTCGHLVTDLSQGSVPALLPYLRDSFHLSYLQVGGVMLALTFSSSVIQPLFGHLSDERGAPWLMAVGPAVGCFGIALLAVAPSYPAALGCVFAAGVGVAAYHPEGSKYAAWLAGERRSTGMSFFSVGGNLGMALGPFLAGLVAEMYGLHGIWLIAIPGAILGVLLFSRLGWLAEAGEPGRRAAAAATGRDRWGPLAVLLAAVGIRGYTQFALLSFVPLFEQEELGNGKAYGSRVLTLLLLSGAIATLAMGPIADRFGRRRALAGSFALIVPTTACYIAIPGPLRLVAIALGGACMISSFGVSIVIAQEYLPSRLSTAAGLSIGLSIGLGGMFALAIGGLADSIGLRDALWTVPASALIGTVLCLLLPAPDPVSSDAVLVPEAVL